jgi:hypothetical protein
MPEPLGGESAGAVRFIPEGKSLPEHAVLRLVREVGDGDW